MGSHQARNFSSPPVSSASNAAVRYLLRGITAAGGYVIAPYISLQEAVDLKLEGKRNETLRQLDEFYEKDEQCWSDMVHHHNLKASRRKRQ
ncbi:PREDICTED: uncharacterized protein LOC104764027 isoform X2 [Camelina sativa]|uniref:Uncharacterized protein LOC104764027 isoform X2 n=1 Tax=Camelina sativa TaxID=90675 RepID=A0ABM0XGS1_CAMSA|nr:PREDICTED: uncharacterized protein LOC104764027 isoform X2 [Camelina sativa]